MVFLFYEIAAFAREAYLIEILKPGVVLEWERSSMSSEHTAIRKQAHFHSLLLTRQIHFGISGTCVI